MTREEYRQELISYLFEDLSVPQTLEIHAQIDLLDKIIERDKARTHKKPRRNRPTSHKAKTRI